MPFGVKTVDSMAATSGTPASLDPLEPSFTLNDSLSNLILIPKKFNNLLSVAAALIGLVATHTSQNHEGLSSRVSRLSVLYHSTA